MILFPHMLAGALVGSKLGNLAAIFLAAVFFHFLLDVIPHWDYLKEEIGKLPQKRFWQFIGKVIIDLVLGIFLLWLIFRNSSFPCQNIAWGAFFGILPDGLIFLNQITKEKIKYLNKFQNFHDRLHWLFGKNEKIPLWQEILIETIVVLGLIFILTKIAN